MELHYVIKHFNELTIHELYALLRLRNEVFIIEQDCPYLDLDGKDQESYHLLYYADGQLAAHTRLLPKGLSYDDVSIGRVVTAATHRGIGLGRKLMDASIRGCYDKFGHTDIRISAQLHLQAFYESLGFVAEGEPYDEDGIPHIEMVKPVSA
jgi:ElaA protein